MFCERRSIMIRIVCPNCKEEISVNMYFYNPRIIKESEILSDREYYHATVRERLLPLLGEEDSKWLIEKTEPLKR